MTPFSIHRRTMMLWMTTVLSFSSLFSDAFSPNSPASLSPSYLRPVSTVSKHLNHYQSHSHSSSSSSSWTVLHASSNNDIHTVQILMSDTGGGHRASANALRDALDVLHPGKFECDIVDIYTEYGPFWPFNGYVQGYKIMAKYSWMWDLFFRFGETEFGLWLNDFLLTTFCYEPFKGCLARPSGSTDRRADMVISVHPLCQDLPLKILKDLDGGKERTTPFITVVTDLGGAHKTWFNPG
jgi:Monogalactosyldiacylglycerol (MGDG) synthase